MGSGYRYLSSMPVREEWRANKHVYRSRERYSASVEAAMAATREVVKHTLIAWLIILGGVAILVTVWGK